MVKSNEFSRRQAIASAVHLARVKFLLVQSPAGIVISPLSSIALSLALLQGVDFFKLVIWNSGMVSLAFLRFLIWSRSPREEEDVPNARFWEWSLGLTMVGVACWWGFGSIFVLPGTSVGDMTVFCAVMMMAGGTSSLYAVHPVATTASVLCLVLPLASTILFTHGLLQLKVLSFGALLLTVGVLRGIQTLNHYLVRSHELTYDLEENLKLLERSEEMRKDLTLMLVHDLRTPLSALITRARMAREYTEEKNPEESMVEIIGTEDLARSLVEMVSSILDVSRMESDELPLSFCPVTTGELIDISLESVAAEVVVEGPTDLSLECDVDLVSRVITNLLGNAVRYQPPGEPVRIEIHELEGEIEFRVIDRGPGIAEKHQNRIFDKYAQGGTGQAYTSGLGLTFCKLAIEQHKGSIGVRSRLREGAQFWFRLPA